MRHSFRRDGLQVGSGKLQKKGGRYFRGLYPAQGKCEHCRGIVRSAIDGMRAAESLAAQR